MAAAFIAPSADGLVVRLRVTPRARQEAIGDVMTGAEGAVALKVSVTAPAEDGKANLAVIDLLSRHWRVARTSLSVRQGATARNKLMHLAGDPVTLQRRIDDWWQQHARRHTD